jgi:enamine deaminase RidA (YjgF/YER057c/UK114 family)
MIRSAPALSALFLLACSAVAAHAAEDDAVKHIPIPNSDFPISLAVRVPAGAETVYFSGMTPTVTNTSAPKDSLESYGNTETQAKSAFERLQGALKSQGLTLGDVVMLHVYLVGDPAHEGKMDFKGLQAAYTQFFGTAEQPNKPSRTTVQIAGLAGPGLLVEVEAIAAKAK